MGAEAWLAKAEKELSELGARAQAELDAADAYRLLVLTARLRLSPGARERAGPVAIDQLAARCRLPGAEELLDALEEACASGEQPHGVVLASLLDVDDLVGVLSLLGRGVDAGEVAGRAAAIASLFPAALVDLGEFAEMRLATLSPDAPGMPVWETVAESPAELLASSLPLGAATPPLTDRARLALERLRTEPDEMVPLLAAALSGRSPAFLLPQSLFARAAAASPDTEETPIRDAEGRRVGVCAVDAGGGRSVQVRLPKGAPAPKRVTAHAGGQMVELRFEPDGRDLLVALAGAEPLAAHGVVEVRLENG